MRENSDPIEPLKVLVTGGAGYIGSHAIQALLKDGHHVVAFDNLSTGFRNSIPANVELIEGDIRDQAKLAKTLKSNSINAVIHFAAKLIVPDSIKSPLEYYDNNIGGTISLLSACRDTGVLKLIFSSTAAVYGETKLDRQITESDLTQPINPYGYSKLACERLITDCQGGFNLRSVCLRYFNAGGAALDGSNGQRSAGATHLIHVAAQTALGKRPFLEVFGTNFTTRDGSGVRDYIHVEDLAHLHVLALNYLNKNGASTILNCGYGDGYSVLQIVDAMKRVSGVDFPVRLTDRREGDPAQLVADSAKAKSLLAWSPKLNDIDLICRTALDWERNHPGGRA